MELILVRHGQPARVERSDGGVADPALTPLGELQAEASAQMLVSEGVHHIVSSPLLRAQQTAEFLAEKIGHNIEIDDRLIELDFGGSDYIPNEQAVVTEEQMERFREDPLHMFNHLGGFEVFRDRVVAAFEDYIYAHRSQKVAVFSHGGVMGTYLMALIGYDWPFLLGHDYCGVSRIRAASNGFRSVQSVNETLHVRGLSF